MPHLQNNIDITVYIILDNGQSYDGTKPLRTTSQDSNNKVSKEA
jgi:hypothetical protein